MEKQPFKMRVDWADLDLFGHVNNVAFFRYMQAARVDFCESLGLTSLNESGRLSFMVASSQCSFRKPLHFPGEVLIHVTCKEARNTSFQLLYKIMNGEAIVAEGEDVLVVYDHVKKEKVAISHHLRAKLEAHAA
jgi:acyl-CoA thioester hydrolase